MRKLLFTKQYKKDFKRAKRSNRDLESLKHVINILFKGGKLPLKYRDHKLLGGYKGYGECHIAPDFPLIYEIALEELILIRLGSHSELFL